MKIVKDRRVRIRGNADRTPPSQAQTNAEAVLAIRDKTDAMTDTGWNRAKQLAEGGELSTTVIQKMAQFKRHQSNTEYANFSDIPESKKSEDAENPWWEDNGTVAWLGWGGTAGIEWAVEQSEELDSNVKIVVNQSFSEGDIVDTPDGVGVVVEIRTEDFDGPDGAVEASEESPAYIVGVESGAAVFRASELSEGEIETDIENPESELTSNLRANQDDGRRFDYPESWEKSDTPARLILLKAWAGLGGRFTTCRREMAGEIASPSRFCASMKDRVLEWEGWRRGG